MFFSISANFNTQDNVAMDNQEGSAAKTNQPKGGKNQKKKGKK